MALKILFEVIVIGLVFGLGIGYAILASSRGHRTAIKEIAQIIIFIGVPTILLFTVLHFIPAEWKSEFLSVTYIGCSALCVILTLLNRWRRRQVSPSNILLNLGRSDDSFWPIICGLILLVFSISSMSEDLIRAKLSFEEGSQSILLISLGICLLFTGLSKTMITEDGILSWLRFVKWENVKAYFWDESKRPVLRLVTTDWLPFVNTLLVQVPATYRESVQELLARKVSRADRPHH